MHLIYSKEHETCNGSLEEGGARLRHKEGRMHMVYNLLVPNCSNTHCRESSIFVNPVLHYPPDRGERDSAHTTPHSHVLPQDLPS